MTDTTVIAGYGLQLVFVTVLLDQAGLPVPSMPFLIACGALAGAGQVATVPLLVTATLASLSADVAWFALGRWQGPRVLRWFSSFSLRGKERVEQAERSLRSGGLFSIALAKFVPGLAIVAPPLAGASGVSLARFAVVSSVTGFAWAGGLVGLGWIFRDTVVQLTRWLESLGGWALCLIGLILAAYVAVVGWRRRRASAKPPLADAGSVSP
jgi:membrane protein DedA with SNARE-associated domain